MMTTTIIIMMMKLIPNLSPPKRESCKEGKVEEYPGEEEETSSKSPVERLILTLLGTLVVLYCEWSFLINRICI